MIYLLKVGLLYFNCNQYTKISYNSLLNLGDIININSKNKI